MGLYHDFAIHRAGARNENAPLFRDADVKIAFRSHHVEITGAALGDDLLESVARVVKLEILDADLTVVRHFGLKKFSAADDDGAHRYLERLAVAPHRLDDFHKAFAKNSCADFFLKGFFQFKAFHGYILESLISRRLSLAGLEEHPQWSPFETETRADVLLEIT